MHHIIPQCEFDDNNTHKSKIHIRKNNDYNLVCLCSSCHDKIDTNEIVINGWKQTSNGKILDYYIQEKETKTKYTPELINFIKELKKTGDPKIARIQILEKYNKKISTQSILKYWN